MILPSLLCFCENPSAVLYPTLGPPVLKGCGCIRAGPEEGLGNGERNGAPLLQSRSETVGVVEPGEGSVQRFHCGLSVLREGL